jgi:hypothetical protein
MKLQIIIPIVLGVVVLGGGAVWGLSYYKSAGGEMVDSSQSQAQAEASEGSGSFNDILDKKGSYKCTFTSTDPQAASQGTVYINGQKISGQFETNVAQLGQTIKSQMIRDDSFTYTWSSFMPQGMKFKNQAAAAGNPNGKLADSLGFKEGVKVDYKCEPWSVDESKFVPPKEVQFAEMAI